MDSGPGISMINVMGKQTHCLSFKLPMEKLLEGSPVLHGRVKEEYMLMMTKHFFISMVLYF